MKKVLIVLSIFCNFIFLFYFFRVATQLEKSRALYSSRVTFAQNNCSESALKKTIAILLPISHPALDQIKNGFMDTLTNHPLLNCKFRIFNANGNRSLMRAQIEEILEGKFDILFTVGALASQMAKEVTHKKQSTLPIVFAAVANPTKLELVNSLIFSGNNLTGSAAISDYSQEVNLLLKIKPSIKNVLVVYDPSQSSGLSADYAQVHSLFGRRGVTVKAVEIYHPGEIIQKIPALLPHYDVVFIFKDNTIVSAVDVLIKLCKQNNVTLFTNDLDSVDKGAALGFGVHERSFGVDAAKCASEILVDEKRPSEVPIQVTKTFKLRINSKVMNQQNLGLDNDLLSLIQAVEIT